MPSTSPGSKKGKSGSPEGDQARSSRFRNGRRPHNARRSDECSTLDELVLKIAQEPRQVMKDGEVVTMSRAERRMRAEVEAGLRGEVRALDHLLKLMIKHPQLLRSGTSETWVFINGALADV